MIAQMLKFPHSAMATRAGSQTENGKIFTDLFFCCLYQRLFNHKNELQKSRNKFRLVGVKVEKMACAQRNL